MPESFETGVHSIAVNGMEQSFRIAGCGPYCIVHSGGPGIDSGYLRLPLLEPHLTMIYLDPIGTGASGRLPTHPMGYTIERFTDQLLAFIEAADIAPPYLLGHSHGAFVALNAALRHPEAIRGLILHAGAAFTGADFMTAASAAIGRFVDKHEGRPAADSVQQAWASIPTIRSDEDYTGAMRQLLPAYFSDYRRFAAIVAQLQDTLHATLLIGDAEPFDVGEQLETLAMPTLIMAGVDDFILGPVHAAKLMTGIPHARLETFSRSGHFAHIEEPEAFAQAVIQFIS